MDTFGYIADILTILTTIFAFLAWMQSRRVHQELKHETARLNKMVTVKLQHGDDSLQVPFPLRRAEMTRAEILGRIGMIPLKGKREGERFVLRYVNTPDFFQQINQVARNDGDALLTIPCDKTEFEQFDVKK